MNIIDLLPLLGGVLSLALGVTVLINGTNKRNMKWPFVLFSSAVGIWAIFISLFHLTSGLTLARFYVDVYYTAALFIAFGFMIFSAYYFSVRLSRWTVALAALPVIGIALFVAAPGFLIGTIETAGQNSVELVQPAYAVYSLFFITYTGIGLGYFWWRTLKVRRIHPAQAILATSLTICLIGGAFFNLLLPGMGVYSYISWGPLFAFLMVITFFYVIARHGLFDIRLAVVRTVTYALSVTTLAAVYLLIAYIIFNLILGQTSSVGQVIINVGLTLALAFLFQPLKRFFDRLTHRLFYKDIYDAGDFYAKMNRLLTSTTGLHKLLKQASVLIADTIKSEQAFLFIFTNEKYVAGGTEGHQRLPLVDARELAGERRMLLSASEPERHVRRLMASHRLALVMPLMQEDKVIGLLCLGEHRTSSYTHRDIKVLRTISDELVIAIQNALSIQEIKDLNASLEQRIGSATRELRASNAQLQRLDEAKDEFISMASHQLRTPLTSIKGYISMMMEGDVGKITPEQRHILNEAFMSSERMVRLIGDFLNVSRLQTGKFVIEKQPVDLAVLVGHEIEALGPNAAARGQTFVYKRPKNVPMLDLDESKIQQVIMNFADNAIYYSKDKSKITVTLAVTGNNVELTVKDNGIGVPESEKAHLFSKFFRATNARKQRPDGTGVGLFLAKKVIDAHDGEIIFESKEGKGSTFGFRLPIKPANRRSTRSAPAR